MNRLTDRALKRFSLEGTVSWVPGGSGLLGTAVSRALAEHGAHVVIAGRNRERAEAVAKELVRDGLSAEAQVLDVVDEAQVENAADSVLAAHGRLDSCVNLAFGGTGKRFEELSASDWDFGMRATSTSAFLVGRAAAVRMQTGGSVVQFSSMYGVVSPDPANYPEGVPINPPDYGFAKAGILQLVRYQATIFGPRGIRINAIVPGPFPSSAARANEEFAARLRARTQLKRLGEANEISGAAVFLCSPASSFVTGSSVTVDGGWTAW